jgi:hypothetical protein
MEMMNQDLHQRAERLILQSRVAAISEVDAGWLASHLESCPSCAGLADATDVAIRSLRSAPVEIDPTLIAATRFRVHQRARELRTRQSPSVLLWLACILSCAWTVVTTPYVWRSLEWISGHLGVPRLVWQMGFGLWWLLPALALAAMLSELKSGRSDQGEATEALRHWE